MFNPQFGVLNHILGLGNTFDWLSAANALCSVDPGRPWIFTPFVAILVLAGIRSLPKEPFEASEVDGASWFYMFRRLMLPMLWPYILVAVIFRFMDNLKVFDHIYVLTAGGPGRGHPHPADRRVRGLDHQPRLLPRQHLHVAALDHRLHHRALPGERARQGAASRCRSGVLDHGPTARRSSCPARSASSIGSVARRRRPGRLVRLLAVPDRVDADAGAEERRASRPPPTSRSARRWSNFAHRAVRQGHSDDQRRLQDRRC